MCVAHKRFYMFKVERAELCTLINPGIALRCAATAPLPREFDNVDMYVYVYIYLYTC